MAATSKHTASIMLDRRTHRRAKVVAILAKMSFRDFVTKAIENEITRLGHETIDGAPA